VALYFSLQHIVEHIDDGEIPVSSAEDIRTIVALVESKAIPLLERARSLKDLDTLIHQDGYKRLRSRGAVVRFSHLIMARLVDNPNYEAIAQAHLKAHEVTGGLVLENFKKLMVYLKEQVVPLA
jgi:hypothetical protein